MAPVDVVELDLHEIPPVAVVLREQAVEDRDVAVVGESEIADASRLAFGEQEVEDAVVDVACFELLHSAAHSHAVQQQVVDAVDLQLLERVAVHGHRRFAAPRGGAKFESLVAM